MNRFGPRLGMPGAGVARISASSRRPSSRCCDRMHANQRFWLEYEVRQYPPRTPDIEALEDRTATSSCSVGANESRGFMPYQPNLVLADLLGLTVVDFPGDHIGYVTAREAFPPVLARVLDGDGGVVRDGCRARLRECLTALAGSGHETRGAHVIRSHEAGSLRSADAGTTVTLAGWVARRRDHGGVIFVDLRDGSGIVQVVFRDDMEAAHALRNEFCVKVTGTVGRRPEGNDNPELPTGEIEVTADELTILSESAPLPIPVDDNIEAGDDIRLRYRYLDLRRSGPQPQPQAPQQGQPDRAAGARTSTTSTRSRRRR